MKKPVYLETQTHVISVQLCNSLLKDEKGTHILPPEIGILIEDDGSTDRYVLVTMTPDQAKELINAITDFI